MEIHGGGIYPTINVTSPNNDDADDDIEISLLYISVC